MASEETTPLITKSWSSKYSKYNGFFTAPYRVLLAGFLIAIAQSFTQVSILYACRLMTCDEFYRHQPQDTLPTGDRCNRNEIDAATAQQVSLLGLSTTICGILNLFVAGWQIKTWGPRAALVCQTALPAVRAALQAVAVLCVGRREGIVLLQGSQLVGLVGGASGYLLVLNTAAGEVVAGAANAPARRTGMFGRLQGCVMLGTAVGYLVGGVVGDAFGIGRPFQAAMGLFLTASVYAFVFIPYIDPKMLSGPGDNINASRSRGGSLRSVLGPFRVLSPWKWREQEREGGAVGKRYCGITFLALGVFLGVLATGYAPVLIQMYATAAFDFHPSELGYLMATNSLMRGFFLIFAFPQIIAVGRRWFAGSGRKHASTTTTLTQQAEAEESTTATTTTAAVIPTLPEAFDPPSGIMAEQEPVVPPPRAEEDAGREFDLFFLRWSLVADGLVTAYTASATAGWHIYLAGFLLPLASGSAPASKGVITEMCPSSMRADALQAMTLVENVAMLSTLGLFGFIFSTFSDHGMAYMTFYCNAAVAMLAVMVLLFAYFPPSGCSIKNGGEEVDEADV